MQTWLRQRHVLAFETKKRTVDSIGAPRLGGMNSVSSSLGHRARVRSSIVIMRGGEGRMIDPRAARAFRVLDGEVGVQRLPG
jgi:hypothetical protein